MSSIQEFLKDGSRHYQGTEEATLRNIEACKDLTQVVRTSLGPNGMNKMVINHLEKLFVTSDAATIIKELEVVHPAAKMVVMASKQQEQEVGDNTNLVVVFAGELLQQAESLIRMGLHISDIVAGYKKAGAKALELLETLVVSSLENLKDQSSVEKAIRSAVTSKQLEWETHLVPAIARACIETLPQNPSAFNVDSVRCCKITGGSVADTQFIHGFALVKDVNGTIRHVKNAKVVVFAGGIEAPKTESKGTVLLTTADELLNYSKGEESQMETIVKNIADSGANVVVSGGAISALALHYLERYKIMVLREGSKFQLRRICRATGATPLARVGKPLPEELGECEEVTVDEVGSTKVTFFRNSSERCQIATLLIRGPTQNTMDDVERAVDDAVNVYKALIRDPRLLAGAGASELELARILMPFGDAAPGLDQYAIKKYAEALEVIPRILADNSGLDSSEIVSSLYAAHTQGKTTFGVNVEAAEIGDAVAINVFDAFVGKYWALKLATDAALTILQVDQIIMAKAADGPKVPQMGARDAD